MSTLILNGRAVRDARIADLKARFAGLIEPPTLAIIQVGDRADSNAYIQAKSSFAAKLGIPVRHVKLAADIAEKELIVKIWECNDDPKVKGIIVQLPLPIELDQDA